MRDIPLFSTQNGVASLILKKIPFSGEAYVHIRDSLDCRALMKECLDVCRMAGASAVYAAGHVDLEDYPLFCDVLRMCARKDNLDTTDAVALPVTLEQKEQWRQLYNQKMACVPSASPLSRSDVEALICAGKAFYIYRQCSAVGIGVAYDGQIHAVASLCPGGGRHAVLALAERIVNAEITLCVASTNRKAIALYKALGFAVTEKEASWFKFFEC